jgi:hypothetical protein
MGAVLFVSFEDWKGVLRAVNGFAVHGSFELLFHYFCWVLGPEWEMM